MSAIAVTWIGPYPAHLDSLLLDRVEHRRSPEVEPEAPLKQIEEGGVAEVLSRNPTEVPQEFVLPSHRDPA